MPCLSGGCPDLWKVFVSTVALGDVGFGSSGFFHFAISDRSIPTLYLLWLCDALFISKFYNLYTAELYFFGHMKGD
jgi:hypothetical protein